MAGPWGMKPEEGRGRSKRLLVDERETHAGAEGPGLQSQLGYSCVILRRLPPFSEPHLFPSNVEQAGPRGPSGAVSYAVDMEEEAVRIALGAGLELGLSRLWVVAVSWLVARLPAIPVTVGLGPCCIPTPGGHAHLLGAQLRASLLGRGEGGNR